MNEFPVLAWWVGAGGLRKDPGTQQPGLLPLSLYQVACLPWPFEIDSIKIPCAFRYNKTGTIRPNKTQIVVFDPSCALLFLTQPYTRGRGMPEGFSVRDRSIYPALDSPKTLQRGRNRQHAPIQ